MCDTINSIPGKVRCTYSVYGSTAFGPVVDARALAIADGTTCNYPQAKSIYWAPALYYRNPLTKRYDLVPSYTFHYYQSVGRFADNYIRKNKMHAWPLNFRLKFGDASRHGGVIGKWSGKRILSGCARRVNSTRATLRTISRVDQGG
jgi:hypothetical protein